MPGFGLTGRPRRLGNHRTEQIDTVWPERTQDQIIGEAYAPIVIPEQLPDGVMSSVQTDPDVPFQFLPRIRIFEANAIAFLPGDGREAETALGGDYINLEGEIRQSKFVRKVNVPMQLATMDTIHGWRQDTNLDDIPWPYRLIAGVDYSGPTHPQHSNVWQLPADFGMGQGNYDPLTTQTPLYPVDVASAFPLDHPVAGDIYGIIGPNEHA